MFARANGHARPHFQPPPRPNISVAWFNPRRRLNAEKLIAYLQFYGLKCWLNHWGYPHLEKYTELRRYQIDQATDDLFVLGAVDVRAGGNGVCVELLVDSLDDVLTEDGPVSAGGDRGR
jgi:hypothetical protein